MSLLRYKSHALIEDLGVGECTMHRASGSGAGRWWQLWFRVLRDSDGQPAVFCVPMNPGGSYVAKGPGGKTWGLTVARSSEPVAPGTKSWQTYPSIDVKANGETHPGNGSKASSLWHQTPQIVGVPDNEPWARGDAP